MSQEPVLRVEGITRLFSTGAGIHDITFTATSRGVTSIIGPNGAGKTVLFTVLAGLTPSDSGNIKTAPGARVAYCPDVPQFEPWLTALEVVETSCAISGIRGRIPAKEALELCGLGKVANRRVAVFSRGMLQRLGIAAALVLNPDILILDEPNSALDPIGRADIRRLIAEQKHERCILLSSHMLSEVEQLADEIVVLDEGRVVTAGSMTDLLTSGMEPIWDIRLSDPSPVDFESLRKAQPGILIEAISGTHYTATYPSFEVAAQELTRTIELLRAPLIEVVPHDRDLDAVFARLIQKEAAS
ncbi:ABC transporter ATP-binding protein [Nesterenkonia ebinurensis]|uniref:ABC transporter ATP-binding protein n=1 Tax=Nesterenkonia ebinurensis TaxID=2608252 RepID=UPI00123E2502|nr:ABC transporter ATP-binding protein [Nesterenkonia ebinurensis]